MQVALRGVRGSIAVPDTAMAQFGGNTSCVAVTTGDAELVILDAGTGIRALGHEVAGKSRRIHILLTHLHLDHITGLLFFAPFFDSRAHVTVWGPPAAGVPLRRRLARFLSSPLSPIEIRDLPATVNFVETPPEPFRIGSLTISAALVTHRGPTLGYRLEHDGASLVYLPDHEPGLGQDLTGASAEWISGHDLAEGASMLLHDGQYTSHEYQYTAGFGHSTIEDAVTFSHRVAAERVLLFHHDPAHDDRVLGMLEAEAQQHWTEHGHELDRFGFAREGSSLVV